MSFQWTLAATFLYIEGFFIMLLLLPLISPQRWQQIFKSRTVTAITSYAALYFNVILLILGLLLMGTV
jgi:B-cell receptor-associated protein 31